MARPSAGADRATVGVPEHVGLTGALAVRGAHEQDRGDMAHRGYVVTIADHQPDVLGRQLRVDLPGTVGDGVERGPQQRVAMPWSGRVG